MTRNYAIICLIFAMFANGAQNRPMRELYPVEWEGGRHQFEVNEKRPLWQGYLNNSDEYHKQPDYVIYDHLNPITDSNTLDDIKVGTVFFEANDMRISDEAFQKIDTWTRVHQVNKKAYKFDLHYGGVPIENFKKKKLIDVPTANGLFSDLKKENDKLDLRVGELKQLNTDRNKDVSKLESQVDELKQQVDDLKKQLKEKNAPNEQNFADKLRNKNGGAESIAEKRNDAPEAEKSIEERRKEALDNIVKAWEKNPNVKIPADDELKELFREFIDVDEFVSVYIAEYGYSHVIAFKKKNGDILSTKKELPAVDKYSPANGYAEYWFKKVRRN